ncbi:MAG: MGMT family protein [Acidimicrobiia bacterium]|nr:MGMT family protein [Acidimicrobiia bacterium]
MNEPDFTNSVRAVIAELQEGEIVTYGEVAAQVGRPGAARAVGHVLKSSTGLPWWRVVTAGGRLVPGAEQRHAELLRAEGIEVADGRIVRSAR